MFSISIFFSDLKPRTSEIQLVTALRCSQLKISADLCRMRSLLSLLSFRVKWRRCFRFWRFAFRSRLWVYRHKKKMEVKQNNETTEGFIEFVMIDVIVYLQYIIIMSCFGHQQDKHIGWIASGNSVILGWWPWSTSSIGTCSRRWS